MTQIYRAEEAADPMHKGGKSHLRIRRIIDTYKEKAIVGVPQKMGDN